MIKNTTKQSQSLKIPKVILKTAKLFSLISPKITTLFAAKLFTTPIKHRIPKRELDMNEKSVQKSIKIPKINKEVVVYNYGTSDKKILLVHGWSGRGTQLYKIADAFVNAGYSTISFDAPAHGKSKGNTSILTEFIESILVIDKQLGPFEAAVGHSLGAMSLLNSVRIGLKIKNLVVVGSGDIIQDILDNFISRLELEPNYSKLLRLHFEKKYGEEMNSYSAYIAAMTIIIPVLVIHDKDDNEVPVTAALHIADHLKNGKLIVTEGLGHQKILGNEAVIENIVKFITNNTI